MLGKKLTYSDIYTIKSIKIIWWLKNGISVRLSLLERRRLANLGNPIRATRPWPNLVTSKPSPPPLEPCVIVQTNNKRLVVFLNKKIKKYLQVTKR
jgi:hypothetical protein